MIWVIIFLVIYGFLLLGHGQAIDRLATRIVELEETIAGVEEDMHDNGIKDYDEE